MKHYIEKELEEILSQFRGERVSSDTRNKICSIVNHFFYTKIATNEIRVDIIPNAGLVNQNGSICLTLDGTSAIDWLSKVLDYDPEDSNGEDFVFRCSKFL